MTTRRSIVKAGAGLAAIIAAGKAPAAIVRSMVGARNAIASAARLPYKKRVEYLESTGTQYINTGLKVNGLVNPIITIDAYAPTGLAANSFFFGATYDGTARFGFCFSVAGPYIQFRLGDYYNFSISFGTRHVYKMDVGKKQFLVDGVLVGSGTKNMPLSQLQVLLFAENLSSGVPDSARMGKCRIFACCIVNDGYRIRDFIPVIDLNDEPCMYDQVTETLFYNQGTGSFIAGPDL